MPSVAPCLDYCSDEKSSQTSLLMELSPLSNNTQPSPKDSGVDVSSPSRRDEDTIFGSPQISQMMASVSNGSDVIKNCISNKFSNGLPGASSDMMEVGIHSGLNIATSVNFSKSDGKDCSKTTKFYSRDRKKHFNIGEFQAKEFRKIIMSDPKDKKKKCLSLTKSSLSGKCSNGHQFSHLGTAMKMTAEDLNKNYAVAPIEEKKVGIVIRVTKPFSTFDSKKRKNSTDKLESSPKKSSLLGNVMVNILENEKIDLDRSSNMSPTMPELHKEYPFVGGKFIDDSRRATRSQVNNLIPSADNLQSGRRSNLRSATKSIPKNKHEDTGERNCPFPPIITAVEPQQEGTEIDCLSKKITCKLAGGVIVKTASPDHQVQVKSLQKSKKSKCIKSSTSSEYLQVKSISGLKIKLAKPKPSITQIISCEAPELLLTKDNNHSYAQETANNSFNALDSKNLSKFVSNSTIPSQIMSSLEYCTSYPCSSSVSVGSAHFLTAVPKVSNFISFPMSSGHLEEYQDGKVKITQEKEVVMPDGKKKKLKLKMFVPSPAILPQSSRENIGDLSLSERLSYLYGQPADATLSSQGSLMPKLSNLYNSPYGKRDFSTLTCNSFSVPDLNNEENLNFQANSSVSVNNWPSPLVVIPQCTSQNDVQFGRSTASNQSIYSCSNVSPGNLAKIFGSTGSCHNTNQLHSESLSYSQSEELWSSKNLLNGLHKTEFSTCNSPKMTPNKVELHHPMLTQLHEGTLTTLNHKEAYKCNSTSVLKSSIASNTCRIGMPPEKTESFKECLGLPYSNSDYVLMPSNCDVNAGSPQVSKINCNSSNTFLPKCLRESCNSLESLSKGSCSIKVAGEELDDYGEMPTLEKNEISAQDYHLDQFDDKSMITGVPMSEGDIKKLLGDPKSKMLEKENLQEKTQFVKKTFKFDGLELEYNTENVATPDEGHRRLRKRSKDEKEEVENTERLEKFKPKRKRGTSRTNAKKMKSSVPTSLETSSHDGQIDQMSHIRAPDSIMSPIVLLSELEKKQDNLVLATNRLAESFDFSTPPPSDASCPLGEFVLPLLDDNNKFASSTVCSKPFYIDQTLSSASVTHSFIPTSFSSDLASSSSSLSTAAFHTLSNPPLPWSQAVASPKSFGTSENLKSTCYSPFRPTKSLDLPVISSHPSPISSVYMIPLSAEIHLPSTNSSVTRVLDSPNSVTTTPPSPSPPPPPPKFVRSFKEVDTSSVLTSSQTSITQTLASTFISPETTQSIVIDRIAKDSFSLSSFDVPDQPGLEKLSNGFYSDSLESNTLLGSTDILNGSCPFVPPAFARCNSRNKFEEKSLRLHKISQRLQENSAISIRSSIIQTADISVDEVVAEKPSIFQNQLQLERKLEPDERQVKEEDIQRKLLDKKFKEYYLNNEEEIAEYVANQVQLVKLRNKAYRLFCCLFPEVQMPLRLSPDSEAVDHLLKSVVNVFEGTENSQVNECESTRQSVTIMPSEEKPHEGSNLPLSKTKDQQLCPRTVLCCQPQKCLLKLQVLVRQFLCLLLPHLDAYLSSDASLTVMDKILDRVVLANCAFIGLGSTNILGHNAMEDKNHGIAGESRDISEVGT